jgi:hypothetical protein
MAIDLFFKDKFSLYCLSDRLAIGDSHLSKLRLDTVFNENAISENLKVQLAQTTDN